MPSSSWTRSVGRPAQNQSTSAVITSNDLIQLESRLKIEFENKIQQQQAKSLDILAIFITLFTFISVNVSIFQKVDNEKAIYFMLLITGAMITLVWTLFLISEYSKQKLIIMLSGLWIILFMPIFWWCINLIWDYSKYVVRLEKNEESLFIWSQNNQKIVNKVASWEVN